MSVRVEARWRRKLIVIAVLCVVVIVTVIVVNSIDRKPNTQAKNSKFPYKSVRLPGNVIPVEYRIILHPNITDGKFGFSGDVRILLEVKKETDSIILHSKSLSYVYTAVHEDDFHGKQIPLKGSLTNEKYELVKIQLGTKMSTKRRYLVHIIFDAKLATTWGGFYKSSYETKNGEKRYLATTQFQPIGARMAFPCFDEPAMKAKFTIIMVREKIHTALSNMPVEKSMVRGDGLVEDHFQKSVRMNTYLVAFVVCDFEHLSTTSKRGVKIKVWAPPPLIAQAKYAIEVTPKILDHYEKLFKLDFPLPKLDLIAVPDFDEGAMENWGLIIYRVTLLLYDEKEEGEASIQSLVRTIAHELAHQWFGNLVTMKWWNDLWLNEGFASLVEYIGADVVEPSWQMMDQFNLDDLKSALSMDSKQNSHSISVPVDDPADIGGSFDAISYNKGASIIRMMRYFIGYDRFNNGIANYLKKYQFGNAVSDDLWTCLSEATNNTINVKAIMDTWTLQMGYPVVNVTRDPKDKEIAILTQERFASDVSKGKPIKTSPFNYRWEVPVTFYFQNNQQKQRKWLHLKDVSVKVAWPKERGWLKLNVNQIGFYRVNYDEENWKALADQLKQDHEKLSAADRANLMNDAFALAYAGRLHYDQALNLTEYLVKEKQYIPFSSGLGSLSGIGGMLLQQTAQVNHEKYILQQISPLVQQLGWEDKGSHLDKFLRKFVLQTAVSYNKTDAVKYAMNWYNEWMRNNKSIPVNLRYVVYLAGIMYGGQKEWDYMFQKYKSSAQPSKMVYMYSLTDTKDPKILKWYLENTLNNDVVKIQDTISVIGNIAANGIGRKMALDFVKRNWNEIYRRYHRIQIKNIISKIFSRGKTEAELTEATEFLKTHKLGAGKLAAKRALHSIRNKINWREKNEKSVAKWLETKV